MYKMKLNASGRDLAMAFYCRFFCSCFFSTCSIILTSLIFEWSHTDRNSSEHISQFVQRHPCHIVIRRFSAESPGLLLLDLDVEHRVVSGVLQWVTADAEIKDPSVENPELKGSPFKAWSRSRISPCMLRLLPGISSLLISTLPVHSPAFSPKPLPSF